MATIATVFYYHRDAGRGHYHFYADVTTEEGDEFTARVTNNDSSFVDEIADAKREGATFKDIQKMYADRYEIQAAIAEQLELADDEE